MPGQLNTVSITTLPPMLSPTPSAKAVTTGSSALRAAWLMGGAWVFLSLLLSLIERGAILRRMPERPLIEKIAARALISNRIVLALTLIGSFYAAIIIVVALTPREWPDQSWPVHAAAAVYFAVAAFDDWRVRGRRFAGNPRALFGCEVLRIRQLDPY